jgi:hypothetical protein
MSAKNEEKMLKHQKIGQNKHILFEICLQKNCYIIEVMSCNFL